MGTEEAKELLTTYDVAELFGLSLKQVNFFLYVLPEAKRYKLFEIQKRAGGTREIASPILPIKAMQRAFAKWLSSRFKPHSHTHGYVENRDIITNADKHVARRWVLRVDLKEFFPTIHFGRVRGLLLSPPYSLSEDVSRLLAHLCCHKGFLPQGAPSSPVVSNLVCRRLDRQLAKLAGEHRCRYTRYADDLVFSTNQKNVPSLLVAQDSQTGTISAGSELRRIIEGNGFKVNDEKTRLYPKTQRQLVTGIVVNDDLNVPREYVRSIRLQIHALKKHGAAVAEKLVLGTYKKNRPVSEPPDFLEVLRGRVQHVGHVRGWGNAVYQRLALSLAATDPEFRPKSAPAQAVGPKANKPTVTVRIYCEGPSDHDHLDAAGRYFQSVGEFSGMQLVFQRGASVKNNQQLAALCESLAQTVHNHPQVFVFDSDEAKYRAEMSNNGEGVKDWGNGVYSLCIAKPVWRAALPGICIEMLYSDGALATPDEAGRRIYLRSEFDENSGRHKTDPSVTCPNMQQATLVVAKAWNQTSNANVALAKTAFASAILEKKGAFAQVSFAGFKETLELLREAAQRFAAKPPT